MILHENMVCFLDLYKTGVHGRLPMVILSDF